MSSLLIARERGTLTVEIAYIHTYLYEYRIHLLKYPAVMKKVGKVKHKGFHIWIFDGHLRNVGWCGIIASG